MAPCSMPPRRHAPPPSKFGRTPLETAPLEWRRFILSGTQITVVNSASQPVWNTYIARTTGRWTMTDTTSLAAQDILATAETWARAGRSIALATVVETWGSAPRPVGSHLVIDQDGNFEGSVSGGCVEGAVVSEALDVIDTGKPTTLEFGVADETAWRVGLSCGGRIRVYVEPVVAADTI